MNSIERTKAREILLERKTRGHHVDERVLGRIDTAKSMFSLSLDDADAFFSLIWQESDPARLLTPSGQPRTLRDVAERLVQKYSFAQLCTTLGLPPTQHDPDWFRTCLTIEESFSYEALGVVSLLPSNDPEQRQSQTGTFYIFDGVHKTLVLATLLLRNLIPYQPVNALLFVPRNSS